MLDRTLNILCGSSNNRLFSKTKLKGPLNLGKMGSKKFTSKAKLQESTVVDLIAIINSIHTHLIHSIRIMKRIRFREYTRAFLQAVRGRSYHWLTRMDTGKLLTRAHVLWLSAALCGDLQGPPFYTCWEFNVTRKHCPKLHLRCNSQTYRMDKCTTNRIPSNSNYPMNF